MDKVFIIQKLKELKPVLNERYGVTELALFGSYSRGEQTEKSDIDILFDYEGKMGSEMFAVYHLIQNAFDKEVQIVSRRGIKKAYFEVIKPDLIYA